jgi:hypothetical protein
MKFKLILAFLLCCSNAFAQGFGTLYNDRADKIKTNTKTFGSFLPASASTVQSALDYINQYAGTGSGISSQWTGTNPIYFNGNVGINTSNPRQILDVGGTTRSVAFIGDALTANSIGVNGDSLTVSAPAGTAGTGNGGSLTLNAGNGSGSGNPGSINITTYPGVTTRGDITISANGSVNNYGGDVTIKPGAGSQRSGGVLFPLGNIGIGTSVPEKLFELSGVGWTAVALPEGGYTGDVLIRGTGVYGPTIGLEATDTGGHIWNLFSTGSSGLVGAGAFAIRDDTDAQYRQVIDKDGNFAFGEAITDSSLNGAKMVIKNTGNVGIGTVNPLASLDVKGSATISGNVGIGTTPTTASVYIFSANTDYTNTGGSGSDIYMYNTNAAGQNVLKSDINGHQVAKWRSGYDGDINWVAGYNGTNGSHNFYIGGDYGDGYGIMSMTHFGIIVGRITENYPQGMNQLHPASANLEIVGSDYGVAGTAGLKLQSGTLLNTPEPGVIESNGSDIYWTDDNSVRRNFVITGTNNVGIGTTNTTSAALAVMGGNVGIGTVTPGQKLDVAGTTRSIAFIGDSIASSSSGVTGDALSIAASSGTSGTGDGGSLTLSAGVGSGSGNPGTVSINSSEGANAPGGITIDASKNINNFAGDITLKVAPASSRSGSILLSGGNVGIGSITPGQVLDVGGTVRAVNFLKQDGSSIGSSNWTTINTNDVYLPNRGNVGIGTTKTTTAALTVMNGNVGIGTWVPGSPLDIRTSSPTGAALNITAPGTSASGVGFQITTALSSDLNTGKVFSPQISGDNYSRFMFYSDGKYGIGSGSTDRDTFISRSTTNTFRISSDGSTGLGNLVVNGNVGIGTTFISGTGESALTVMNGNVGIGTWVPVSLLNVQENAIGSTSTDGLVINNTTAAANGSQQFSPRLRLSGQGWGTTAGTSQPVDVVLETAPVQSTVPRSYLKLSTQINNGGYDGQLFIGADPTDANYVAFWGGNLTPSGTNYFFEGKRDGSSVYVNSSSVASVAVANIPEIYVSANGLTIGKNPSYVTPETRTLTIFDRTAATGVTTAVIKAGAGQSTTDLQEWQDNSGNILSIVNSSGNVGIGTLKAGGKLSVVGNVGIGTMSYSSFVTTAPDANGMIVEGNVGIGTTKNSTAGLSVMNGNVGIGTWVVDSGALIVNTGNNVGIGTIRPGQTLDVGGTVRAVNFVNQDGTPITSSQWATQNTTDVSLAGGNVGIGTTKTTTAALTVMNGNVGIGTWKPGSALSVIGNIYSSGNISSTGTMTSGNNFTVTGSSVYLNSSGVSYLTGAGTGLSITGGADAASTLTFKSTSGTGTSDYIKFIVGNNGGTEALRINTSGNLGIGTASPRAQLDVAGTLAPASPFVMISSGNVGIGTANPFGGQLIVSTGNVGINTLVPGQALDVGGTVRAIRFIGDSYISNSTGTTGDALNISATSGTSGTGDGGSLTLSAGAGSGSGNPGSVNINSSEGVGTPGNITLDATNNINNYAGDITLKVAAGSSRAGNIILTGGNVGVGSTVPGQKLDVGGTVRAISYVDQTGAVIGGGWTVSGNDAYKATGNVGIGSSVPRSSLDVNGSITASNTGDSYFLGNVGIGTSVPGSILDISSGQFRGPIGSVIAGNSPGISFTSITDTGFGADANNLAVFESGVIALDLSNALKEFRVPSDYKFAWSSATNNNSSSDTNIYRNGAGVIRTASSLVVDANIGIGIISPTQVLDVAGTVNALGFLGNSLTSRSSGTSGNAISIAGASGTAGAGDGGAITISGGVGSGSGNPGSVTINASEGVSAPGNITIDASNNVNNYAGDIKLKVAAAGTRSGNIMLVGGNVGIGSLNPTSNLDVIGTVKATHFMDTSGSVGYAVCTATGGVWGHCTSIVAVDGTCTCVAN